MGNKVEIDRSKLHPWLDYKLGLLLKYCEKNKTYIIVTCGYRSSAEQDLLYSQGRTSGGAIITNARGGHSQHNWGIAIDIAMRYDVDKDGVITDDTWSVQGFKQVAKMAKKLGFGWGGDWKSFTDYPHFYLTKWGDTPTQLINKYGSFAKFKKTWTKTATYKTGTRVRKSKLFSSTVLVKIPRGAKCEVLWTSKLGYSKVRYGIIVGYAKNKYLK